MNDIKIGKTYKMSDVEVVCVGFTKKGYAKMQTLGMTSGHWPGVGDISDYDDVTRHFTDEWKEVIKKFRLPTLKKAEANKNVRTALAEAAENHNSFGASYGNSWLGTAVGSNYAWYVYSDGYIDNGNYQNYSYVVAPAFNLNISKVIVDGNEIKKARNDDIEFGKTYKMSGIEVVCVGYTKKGYAKMQTLGMTAGAWPGEGDISNYDDTIKAFTKEWAGIIKKFKLPTKEQAKNNPLIAKALRNAAYNYSSFKASSGKYSWLGTSGNSCNAWFIYSSGSYYYNSRNYDFVVAPKFNLNTSKVIVDGDEIKKQDLKQESIFDKIKSDIEQIEISGHIRDVECFRAGIDTALNVIIKYKMGSKE